MRYRGYVRPGTLEEAWELNQKKANRVAGGAMWLRLRRSAFGTLIDLEGLGLDRIEETDGEIRVGAMVTLRQLEQSAVLERESRGAVREALRHIVGVQFRNMATVGGSLAGRFGFSDVLTVFLVMDSYVELYKGGRISLRDYADRKPDRDILTALVIRKNGSDYLYRSVRNNATDLPVLTVALARSPEGRYTVAVGARPGRARIAEPGEGGFVPGPTDETGAAAFARRAAAGLTFGSNTRGGAAYRRHLARTLIARGLLTLEGRSGK